MTPAEDDWAESEDLEGFAGEGPAGRPLRVLIVCNYDIHNAATVCDHVNAFLKYSANRIFVLSRVGELFSGVDLDNFDVVIVHYSINMALWPYMSAASRRQLAAFGGLKAAFIQDEYRFVNATTAVLAECGISLVFTCLAPPEVAKVYGDPSLAGVRFHLVLTGYVPEWLTTYVPRPLDERPIMVGYRGRTSPAWLGEAGQEKIRIGRQFKRDAGRYRLTTDIAWSEESRLYARDWLNFIRRCRAVLAVESGSSVFDFEGRISAASETYAALARQPKLLGRGSREVAYEELRQRYFAGIEDQIDIAQISPRIFEAIALRTLVVAYPGGYSGLLQPWRHYVPLAKDHSNMAEVAATVKDTAKSSEIIANAYAEVAMNPDYSFRRLIAEVDGLLREVRSDPAPASLVFYTPEDFHRRFGFRMVANPHDVVPPASRGRRFRDLAVRIARRALASVIKMVQE